MMKRSEILEIWEKSKCLFNNLTTKFETNISKKKKLTIKYQQEQKYSSLAPRLLTGKERQKNEIYFDALEEAVYTSQNKNIALMGNYGSGKTSILETFKYEHEEFNFLNLSLASFNDDKEDNVPIKGQEVKVSNKVQDWEQLENSLVKQMIYRQKKRKMAYSSFKRINHISKLSIAIHTLVISTVLILFLLSTKNALLIELFPLKFFNSIIFRRTVYAISFGFFIYYFYFILHLLIKTFNLSKLSFSAFTIESKEEENSYFSKYLDEILYFFQVSKTNVVIIEDIDRFGSFEVFEHLRELNYLLNNSAQLNTPVTFIYALGDGIFNLKKANKSKKESSEYVRTKFFDFIIPIIPVVDASNSKELFIPEMKNIINGNSNPVIPLSDDLTRYLRDISLYIDDLRLIHNVSNEFRIYKSVLTELNESDIKKLIAMVIYKNIQPEDFAALQAQEGLLYQIIYKEKKIAIKTIKDEIAQKINLFQNELEQSEQLLEKKLQAATYYLINKHLIPQYFGNGFQAKKDGEAAYKHYSFEPYSIDEIELILSNDVEIRFFINTSWTTISKKDKEDALNIVGLDFFKSYHELNKKKKKEIIDEIKLSKQKFASISTMNIKNVMRENNHISKFTEISFPEYNLLIKYFLQEGYIDEDYENFISHSYNITLSSNDRRIIRKIKSSTVLDDADEIQNYDLTLHELEHIDYERPQIINRLIVLYIFNKTNMVKEQLIICDTFIDKLDGKNKAYFLEDLFDTTYYNETEQFVLSLFKKENNIYNNLQKHIENPHVIRDFVFRIFFSLPKPFLKQILADDLLRREVENTSTFITSLENKEIGNIIEFEDIFQTFEFKFKDADILNIRSDQVDFVLDNNLYEINFLNISNIFISIIGLSIESFSLSKLQHISNKNFQENFKKHFEEFVSLLFQREVIYEDNDMMLKILNYETTNNFLNLDNKVSLIYKNTAPIIDISQVIDTLCIEAIYLSNNYEPTLDNLTLSTKHNVVNTYKKLRNSEAIEQLITEFNRQEDSVVEDKEAPIYLYMKDVISKGFELDAYNIMFFSLYKYYSIKNMSDITFEMLLEKNAIPVTLENINLAKKEAKIKVILQNEEESFRLKNQIELNEEEKLIGLTKLNGEMLDYIVERSFTGNKLNILNVEEWIGKVIDKRINLKDTFIISILENENLRNSNTLRDIFLYLLSENKLTIQHIKKYLHYLDPSLGEIEIGVRKKYTLDTKWLELLLELRKLNIFTSVTLGEEEVTVFTKKTVA